MFIFAPNTGLRPKTTKSFKWPMGPRIKPRCHLFWNVSSSNIVVTPQYGWKWPYGAMLNGTDWQYQQCFHTFPWHSWLGKVVVRCIPSANKKFDLSLTVHKIMTTYSTYTTIPLLLWLCNLDALTHCLIISADVNLQVATWILISEWVFGTAEPDSSSMIGTFSTFAHRLHRLLTDLGVCTKWLQLHYSCIS